MQPDRKLKKVAEEIKNILLKNNMAGVVALHLPGHGEFVNHLHTRYSCIKVDSTQGTMHIRSKLEDYQGDTEKWIKARKDTGNMLHLLSEITGKQAMDLFELSKIFDDQAGTFHYPGELDN